MPNTAITSVPNWLHQHALLLADYCLAVQAGERVLIKSTTLALPLIEQLYPVLLQRGAEVLLHLEYPHQNTDFLRYASDTVLNQLHPSQWAEVGNIDLVLHILTPQTPSQEVDAQRLAHRQQLLGQLNKARRAQQRSWCITLYPTEAGAQDAGMSLREYQDFVQQALCLHLPNPVDGWRAIHQQQARLIEHLSRGQQLRIVAPETDLSLLITDRWWANSDGKRNMPSGEVYTGPIETSACGHIHFDLPSRYLGQAVSGIRLRFLDGYVTEASAEVGQDVLFAALDSDIGARFLGEIGIGTNYGIQRASQNILFDEKIGGTVHLALGSSYPETGGINQSAIHWDMIRDLRSGGQLWLDDVLIQENGQFLIDLS